MPKAVHTKIFALIDAKKSGKAGKIDHVLQTTIGYACQLHGTTYFVEYPGTYLVGVLGGSWQTVTTKDRINALARHFKLPTIYQRDFVWYWSDGQPYDGIREFPKEDTNHAASLNECF